MHQELSERLGARGLSTEDVGNLSARFVDARENGKSEKRHELFREGVLENIGEKIREYKDTLADLRAILRNIQAAKTSAEVEKLTEEFEKLFKKASSASSDANFLLTYGRLE